LGYYQPQIGNIFPKGRAWRIWVKPFPELTLPIKGSLKLGAFIGQTLFSFLGALVGYYSEKEFILFPYFGI